MKQTTRLYRFFHPMIVQVIALYEATPIASRRLLIMEWKSLYALLAVFILAVLSPDQSHAIEWKDLWQTPDQQAQALLQDEKFEAAAAKFEDPEWRAIALYRAKKYKQSAEALEGIESADAWYDRGNALAKSGDLKAAANAYEQALKIDKMHEDAKFNLNLVKKAMQQQQSERKQSGDQNRSDKSDKSKQQSDEKKQGDQGDKSGQNSEQSEPQSSENRKDQSRKQSGQNEKEDNQPSESQQSEQQAMHSSENKEQEKAEEEMKASVEKRQADRRQAEEEKAQQQWLRRIPDDPGGLLRRKFRYQYRERGRQSANREEQVW